MKHIRTRIAAAVVAAAAAACTMQAVTASAYVSNHANWLTGQTQESTEYGANFAHSLYYLQRSLNNAGINTFTDSVQTGLVLGPGYTTANLSGIQSGTSLSGSLAWARYLGNSFYGSQTVYTEQPASRYSSLSDIKQGDQIVISTNGRQYAVFVTAVNDSCIYVSELWGDAIMWGIEFTRTSNNKLKRTFGGVTFNIDYIVRPVKEGDANGDSVADFMDVVWIANNIGGSVASGVDYTTQMIAADLNGNWGFDQDDAIEVYYHIGSNRMNGDYRYVTTWHSL